jgi:Tfp pilus assembly protein PilX
MTILPRQRRTHRFHRRRGGMAIYVYVVSIAALVSLLGLAASAVVRVERRQTSSIANRLIARAHAHSAIELGLRTIRTSTSWRSTYASGVATTPLNLGTAAAGSVSWLVQDSDGSLTDADTLMRIKGIGRAGDSVQVASVQLQANLEGPTLLRWYIPGGSNGSLEDDQWWGQYFKPTLPADAHRWWVSTVYVYARRANGARALQVRLYRPNGSNMPSTEIIDETNLNSNDFSTTFGWKSIPMSGVYTLAATEGLCLAFETAQSSSIEIAYVNGGVSQTNSAMLRGTPGWNTYDTNSALSYSVYGYYTTLSGVSGAAGTWVWDSP